MLTLKKYIGIVLLSSVFIGQVSYANATLTVPMYFTSEHNTNEKAGTIEITETAYGLLFTPHLQGLTPGIHGLHIHQNPSCENNGMAAGGHFDPHKSDKHRGPYDNSGHLGDLPALYINANGTSTLPVLAPRITHLSTLKDHAIMVHDGGDNYSDLPEKLGGGGSRMVCGVIK